MSIKRNALLEAVYSWYTSHPDSDFATAIEDRFYTYEAEQGAAYPHAVMLIVSDVSQRAIKTPLSVMEWQINCYSQDITEVNNLAAWCRELFEDVTIFADGCRFACAWENIVGPIRSDDQQPWETYITFFSA
jgi:hypothetical protein